MLLIWPLWQVTTDSIGEMFADARRVMKWLADCAREVASHGHAVSWLTPLGLPVQQDYKEMVSHRDMYAKAVLNRLGTSACSATIVGWRTLHGGLLCQISRWQAWDSL